MEHDNENVSSKQVWLMRSVHDIIKGLPRSRVLEISAPPFKICAAQEKLVLGVHSMQNHTTDEGWQITHGLSLNGYRHCGHMLEEKETDVANLIEKHHPGTIVVQDVREWDVQSNDFRDKEARFTRVESMKSEESLFRVTVLKDSHQRPEYHSRESDRIGVHAWIVYYNDRIVKHLAPYVRPQHLIRTTHSIDSLTVPDFSNDRPFNCLFSGAVSGAYPLRQRMLTFRKYLPMHVHNHPGYHRNGCVVPDFLKLLNQFKVSICTSSRYGYSLRKLIESTACGCRVITDLPVDEILPVVEENLIRISPMASRIEMKRVIEVVVNSYDYEKQRDLAKRAIEHYDYRAVCSRLANDIQTMKERY